MSITPTLATKFRLAGCGTRKRTKLRQDRPRRAGETMEGAAAVVPALRRSARRYSSQREEVHHVKQACLPCLIHRALVVQAEKQRVFARIKDQATMRAVEVGF